MMTEIKGWHVLSVFVLAFGVIIGVNLTLAFNAVRTFPGLEVSNSYIASQSFDADREAQLALEWDVSAELVGSELVLRIVDQGQPIAPMIDSAVFGRATSVKFDQTPDFSFHNGALRAHVGVEDGGNWNLRLRATAADGTLFQQRIVVKVVQ